MKSIIFIGMMIALPLMADAKATRKLASVEVTLPQLKEKLGPEVRYVSIGLTPDATYIRFAQGEFRIKDINSYELVEKLCAREYVQPSVYGVNCFTK